MAKKIQIIGQTLVITDTVTGQVDDYPKSEYFYKSRLLTDNGVISFYNLDYRDDLRTKIAPIALTDAIDENDAAFTENSFVDFCRNNLGFKVGGGNGDGVTQNLTNTSDLTNDGEGTSSTQGGQPDDEFMNLNKEQLVKALKTFKDAIKFNGTDSNNVKLLDHQYRAFINFDTQDGVLSLNEGNAIIDGLGNLELPNSSIAQTDFGSDKLAVSKEYLQHKLEAKVDKVAGKELIPSEHIANLPKIATNEANIADLTAAQSGGLKSFTTLALLQAYATPNVNDSYKVTNDPTTSNNGYYHWVSGTTYEKDYNLVNGVIEDGNIDAVSGDLINETTKYKSNLEVGLNKFNKNAVLANTFMTNLGVLSSNAGYSVSEYMRLSIGVQYWGEGGFNSIKTICYFDANKNFLSGESYDINTFTVPSNAIYTRVCVYNVSIDDFQLEEGSTSTVYQDYEVFINEDELKSGFNIFRKDTETLPLDLDETNWATKGKNLFNVDTIDVGYFVNWTNGDLAASSNYDTSDFIPVLQSTDYVFSGSNTRSYVIYDENKLFVSGDQYPTTINTGVNGCYIKVSYDDGEGLSFQVEQGTTATSYESFGYTAPYLRVSASNNSKWNGKKAVSYGDSITAQNEWQPFLATNLGLLMTVDGVGGCKISSSDADSMNLDARINALPTDADTDLLIVLGGTNDWAQDVVLGLETSTTQSEFYGALNIMIPKLINRYPNKKILFLTTPYGELPDRVNSPTFWVNAYTNNQGLRTKDYAEAVRNRCREYGISFADLDYDCGINNLNVDAYMKDDGGHLHPNSELGAPVFASVVLGKLKELETLL